VEPVEGIAAADAVLGQPVPLPGCPLPLVAWVQVHAGDGAVRIEWNLDDSRPGTPGRLLLEVARQPLEPRELDDAAQDGDWRIAPLNEAQASLRPVAERSWEQDGLHLRLTAQGAWDRAALDVIAASIR
jgi:hypothetical protein